MIAMLQDDLAKSKVQKSGYKSSELPEIIFQLIRISLLIFFFAFLLLLIY